jgi:hypothetical protein
MYSALMGAVPAYKLLSCTLAIAASCCVLVGCGPRTCDEEAKQAEATSGAEQAKKVRASCERRVAGMKDSLTRDEQDRQTTDRRNEFINRADAHGDSVR